MTVSEAARRIPVRSGRGLMAGVLLWLVAATPAWAHYRLACEVTYAGDAHGLTAHPVADAYTVPSVDIAGRFRFKPVLSVGPAGELRRVALYVYADTPGQPVLIQHASYPPPDPPLPPGQQRDLTGTQHLYAGPQERELIYHCTLHHDAPEGRP